MRLTSRVTLVWLVLIAYPLPFVLFCDRRSARNSPSFTLSCALGKTCVLPFICEGVGPGRWSEH